MMAAVRILILLLLLLIAFQDFRSRSVYWILFPVLALLFFTLRLLHAEPAQTIAIQTACNSAFVLLQLLILTLYFSARQRRWTNITKDMLGWGDILFLGALTLALSFPFYLVFYLTSLMISLLIWAVHQAFIKNDSHIPLAGLQSLSLVLFLLMAWIMRWDVSANPELLNAISG